MCIVSSFFALQFKFLFFFDLTLPLDCLSFFSLSFSFLLCVSLDSPPWNSHWHTSSTTSSFPSRANLLPLIILLRPSPTPCATRSYSPLSRRAHIAKQPLHLRWRRRRHHRLRRRKCRRRFHHRYYHSHTKMRLSRLCIAVFRACPQTVLPPASQEIFLFDLLSFIFDDSAAARCTRWLPTMMSSFRRDIPTYISRRCSPFRGTGLDAPVSSCVIVRLIQVISIDANVHGLFHLSILNWHKERFLGHFFILLILAFLRIDPWKWINDDPHRILWNRRGYIHFWQNMTYDFKRRVISINISRRICNKACIYVYVTSFIISY